MKLEPAAAEKLGCDLTGTGEERRGGGNFFFPSTVASHYTTGTEAIKIDICHGWEGPLIDDAVPHSILLLLYVF